MNVVIVGCGRVGARIAATLDGRHQVTVIDRSPSSFSRLPDDFGGETLLGNGIDADTLREAGVEEADVFLALTDADNSNLMAAQVARQLGAMRCLARVYDAERSDIFADSGLLTFSPTIEGARRLFDLAIGAQEE